MAYTTINKSTDHFNTKLYTGNSSTNNITGVGFQPDWLWIKSRSTTENHVIYDAIRGVTKQLYPNTSGAESTNATALTAFGTDGFNLATSNANTNANGTTFASWNWKAGGGQGSSNTDGSINTTYTSANTTAGFSISTYTGTGSTATVGHGLGVVPKMIIVKKLNALKDWRIYHASVGNTKQLFLNDSGTADTDSTIWNNTSPTSSVFTIGTNGGANDSGSNYVAYCFAEKTGYSKFGSYTGNGNADGTFVYTGFKPAFIIVKKSNLSEDWEMFDNKRLGYNVDNNNLVPNTTSIEATTDRLDIVSNGFKFRATSGSVNASGDTYIYMAFGQSLVGSNNVPCTAR